MDNTTYPYKTWIQEALYTVIKKAIEATKKNQSTHGHALFITFKTAHPDVTVPESIKTQYPEQITIVLEHEFYNLTTAPKGFSVNLSFNNQIEHIFVAYGSIISFSDPNANMMLDVDIQTEDSKEDTITDVKPKEGKLIKFPKKGEP